MNIYKDFESMISDYIKTEPRTNIVSSNAMLVTPIGVWHAMFLLTKNKKLKEK